MEAYYYSRMNKTEQAAYYAMLQGFQRLDSEIQMPRLEGKALYDVFFRLRLDHLEIFWAVSFKYRYYLDSDNLLMTPEYLFEKSKIKDHKAAMQSRIKKLTYPANKLSPLEKELYIHDFICKNVRYDKLKKPYSHEIIGPLGQGVGVCEGIAKTVKILCDALQIPCVIALCGNNPEKGIKYLHTWNVVQLNGQWYHLDATFDNSLGKPHDEIRYDYFNLDDRAIFRDHEPLIAPAPTCTDGGHFYYREKKLSFTKEEDVYKRALQAAKKGKVLIFHWRGGYLTREVLQQLLGQIKLAGESRGKQPVISLNWPQSVLRVHFEDSVNRSSDTPEAVMEQANEGEQY